MLPFTDLPELIVIRHGETEWNRAGRWQGDLDSPLTETGRAQALSLAGLLAAQGVTPATHRAYTSPLGRARATAALTLGKDWPVTEDARLREIGVGDWTGLPVDEIRRRCPLPEDAHFLALYEAAPGGEPFETLKARCAGFLRALTGPSVIVTHGITSRMMRTLATGRDLDRFDEVPGGQGVIHRVRGGVHETFRP